MKTLGRPDDFPQAKEWGSVRMPRYRIDRSRKRARRDTVY
jgi:hypothetical protein